MTKLSAIPIAAAVALLAAMPAIAFNPDTEVSVGSPPTPLSENKQNEPALAVDASRPNILGAGSNDEIDEEACNARDDTTCPFTGGVGAPGVYSSFDSGTTCTQPTYTGRNTRNCPARADNASSSRFFGTVCVCWAQFKGQEKGNAAPAPLKVGVSRDGGDTWTEHPISASANNSQRNPMDGCTVRTDSSGNAYVFGV